AAVPVGEEEGDGLESDGEEGSMDAEDASEDLEDAEDGAPQLRSEAMEAADQLLASLQLAPAAQLEVVSREALESELEQAKHTLNQQRLFEAAYDARLRLQALQDQGNRLPAPAALPLFREQPGVREALREAK